MGARYVQRLPMLPLVFVILFVACGGSDSTDGIDVDAGSVSTTSQPLRGPRFAETVGGEWRLVGTGIDEGIEGEVAWEIAGKSDGETACYYAEFDPPPAEDYYVDPVAPYSPDREPTDVLSGDGLAEDAADVLDVWANCALVPTDLDSYAHALNQPEVVDPAAFLVVDIQHFEYHFVNGVVASDASVVRLTFDDGTTRDVSPVDGHFLAVFPPEQRLVKVDVSNEEVTVACTVVGQEVDGAGCGGPVLRRGTSA